MRDELAKELEKIGLSENEAKVYLAGLESGPSTAQMLAAKATVSRPTTYIMIESLIKRGLMSSFMKGKKKYFVSGDPNQLLYILKEKKRLLEEQEKALGKIVKEIEELKSAVRPIIMIEEGIEAIKNVQQELNDNKLEVREIVPVDVVRKFIPPIFPGDIRENFLKKFNVKSLYTSANGPIAEKTIEGVQSRYLSPKDFKIDVEILIFGAKVILISYDDGPTTFHINSPQITNTMKTLFDALWEKGK